MRVLQLVDSLALGGLERVAVDLANLQAAEGAGLLCASRESGPLRARVSPDVDFLLLERRGRFDLRAVQRLANWIDDRRVDLVHAHGSSLLLANLVVRRTRHPVALVWHDHYGRWATHPRAAWFYRLLTRRVDGVIAVNEPLRRWSVERLGIESASCRYIRNAVHCPADPPARLSPDSSRVVTIACVANLRPQKDHETLLRSTADLVRRIDRPIHLQLIGGASSLARQDELRRQADALGLGGVVQFLGARDDVPELLCSADLGVLASTSEGLPLALLEYGCAALPVVCTSVGQIPDVVGSVVAPETADAAFVRHEAGLLVEPGDASGLTAALARIIENPSLGRDLGQALFRRVQSRHGLDHFHDQVKDLYRELDVR